MLDSVKLDVTAKTPRTPGPAKTLLGASSRLGALAVVFMVATLPSAALALTADEARLLEQVREVANAPIEDFTPLGEGDGRDGGYRYQLAFLGYGLCSVVDAEPALHDEGRRLLGRLVEKMEHPTTIAYWRALGYGADGLAAKNVMYRGHLNLLYALAHDRFAETRFDEKFHALSRALAGEMGPQPICCEPDQLFIQCNAVTALSLYLHDRAFGTRYGDAGKRLLAWAREHMPLEGTSLVREDYHPSTGKSSARRSAYANAWVISFLAAVPDVDGEARTMYADWKRLFVDDAKVVAVAEGAPPEENLSAEELATSSLLATTFGALAAQEMGDRPLHRKLVRTRSLLDRVAELAAPSLPPARKAQARTWRTLALFARTFRGWRAILKTPAEF